MLVLESNKYIQHPHTLVTILAYSVILRLYTNCKNYDCCPGKYQI